MRRFRDRRAEPPSYPTLLEARSRALEWLSVLGAAAVGASALASCSEPRLAVDPIPDAETPAPISAVAQPVGLDAGFDPRTMGISDAPGLQPTSYGGVRGPSSFGIGDLSVDDESDRANHHQPPKRHHTGAAKPSILRVSQSKR